MLIELTSIGHPDIDEGAQRPLYVDARHVMLIERGVAQLQQFSKIEAYRQALQSLHEEVDRIVAEANALPKTVVPQNEDEARQVDRWMSAREAAASLQSAHHLIARAASEPVNYPLFPCTIVSLACGTALEHGVMLCRIHVMESPQEVREKLEKAKPAGVLRLEYLGSGIS